MVKANNVDWQWKKSCVIKIMWLRLKNKRVLVTGSSRGIGLAIAKGFLNEEAMVVLSSRNQNELDLCKEKLLKDSPSSQIKSISCDFTKIEEIQKIKEKIVKQWGDLDIVVVNVGSGKSVLDPIPSAENFDHIFSLNFESAVHTAREFFPLLKSSGGNFIFICSIAGLEAMGAPVDYAVAKKALIAFAKNLARKVASEGVRVNCIAAGNIYFEGGSWDEKMKLDPQNVNNIIKSNVPMQRFGKTEEITDAALFLSSERASFITGTVLRVDGGQTAGMF